MVDGNPTGLESSNLDPEPFQNPLLKPLVPTRSGRQRRAPKRHLDFVPSSLRELPSTIRDIWQGRMAKPAVKAPAPPCSAAVQNDPSSDSSCSTIIDSPNPQDPATPQSDSACPIDGSSLFHDTDPNEFGIFRRYTSPPPPNPEVHRSPEACVDSPHIKTSTTSAKDSRFCAALRGIGKHVAQSLETSSLGPFRNITTLRFMSWFYSGKTGKSSADCQELVKNVILADDFDREHLRDFNIRRQLEEIDEYNPISETLTAQDGWREGSVEIPVPMEGCKYPSMQEAPTFEVKGLHYRPIIEVM